MNIIEETLNHNLYKQFLRREAKRLEDEAIIIKECPFCGTADEEVVKSDEGHWYCHCLHCHAEGPLALTERLAIKAWNTRR